MTPLIKKAYKGNRDAMTELYRSNKQRVFYVCGLLLCDPKAADHACVHVFKNAWEYLLDGKIETEQEFTDFVVRKAVYYCKNRLTKSNNKAFRIPTNKNFGVMQYETNGTASARSTEERILAALPPLHRLIYVLRSVGEWSEEEIAELLHTKPDVVKAALDAEQTNLDRLTYAIKQNPNEHTEISVREFHTLLADGIAACRIPRAVDTVIAIAIDAIADPIAERAKKRGLGSHGSVLLL